MTTERRHPVRTLALHRVISAALGRIDNARNRTHAIYNHFSSHLLGLRKSMHGTFCDRSGTLSPFACRGHRQRRGEIQQISDRYHGNSLQLFALKSRGPVKVFDARRILVSQSRRLGAGLLLTVLVFLPHRSHTRLQLRTNGDIQGGVHSRLKSGGSPEDPYALLARADRFYWLNNRAQAAPLYAKAERLFVEKGDVLNQVHAKVGYLRSEAERMSFVDVSRSLDDQLRNPVVLADSRLRMWCLIAKGYTDIEIDYRAAKQDWLQVQDIAKSLSENRWVTRASGELGLIAFLEGNLGQAARLVGGALLSTITTGDIGGQIRFLELIGTGFEEGNRHNEALRFFDRAIRLAGTEKDCGLPFMAYEGKAKALLALGKPNEAEPILESTLAQARSQQKRGQEAQLLILLGRLAAQTGSRNQAIAYLEAARKSAAQVQFFRLETDTMFELANLYRDSGDLATAAARAAQGLIASRRIGDRYYVPRNLTILAELEARRGRAAEANALYKQAEDTIESILMSVDQPFWNSSVAGAMSQTYLHHFELLNQTGDVTGAFKVLERIRGRTLVWRLEDKQAYQVAESKQTVALERDLANVQTRLMQTTNVSEREQLLDRLVEYERRLGLAWLKDRIPRQHLQVTLLNKVEQDLQPGEVFLEYVLDDPSSFCLSVSRNGAYVRSLPAGRKEIEELTQKFIDEIHSKDTEVGVSEQLYALLVKPIPETSGATRFIIAPDGILNLVPFEALRNANGEYLIKSRVISYVPSGTILDRLRRIAGRQLAPRKLLAVGDVVYESQAGGARTSQVSTTGTRSVGRGIADLSGIGLHNLPHTREEVEEIGKIFGRDVVVLLGKDATETAFKREPLDQFQVLHLAVHGFADTQYPERSALVLGIDPKSDDDGLLQAREITRLRLNAELTTLSACDSGEGMLQGQEGISNLVEAFLVAGSKSVVASLWNADDTFASALMQLFYRRLAHGDDLGNALRNAKLALLTKYGEQASPYYWAGFVIVGEGITSIPIRN